MLQDSRHVTVSVDMKSMLALVWLVSSVGWFKLVKSTCLNHSSFESVWMLESAFVRFLISSLCRLFVTCSFVLLCSSLDLRSISESVHLSILFFLVGILINAISLAPCVSEYINFALLVSMFWLVFDFPSTHRSTFFCSVACHSPIFVLNVPKRWSGNGFVRQSIMFSLVSIY